MVLERSRKEKTNEDFLKYFNQNLHGLNYIFLGIKLLCFFKIDS